LLGGQFHAVITVPSSSGDDPPVAIGQKGWVGPRNILDAVVKKNILMPLQAFKMEETY
jgi:hypothetical protein